VDDDWPFSFETFANISTSNPALLRGALKHWKNCRLVSLANVALPH
jgi:hypothetical protein